MTIHAAVIRLALRNLLPQLWFLHQGRNNFFTRPATTNQDARRWSYSIPTQCLSSIRKISARTEMMKSDPQVIVDKFPRRTSSITPMSEHITSAVSARCIHLSCIIMRRWPTTHMQLPYCRYAHIFVRVTVNFNRNFSSKVSFKYSGSIAYIQHIFTVRPIHQDCKPFDIDTPHQSPMSPTTKTTTRSNLRAP